MADLTKLTAALTKKYGEHLVDSERISEFVPTGNATMDRLLGGGIPRGRIMEWYGLPSCGKSTLAMSLAAKQFLALGEHVVWVDFEHVWLQTYADRLGVKNPGDGRLIVLAPATIEECTDVLLKIMSVQGKGLYVIDSLSAGIAAKVLNSDADKQWVGAFSMAVAPMMNKLNQAIAQYGGSLILVNQTRTSMNGFRVEETTPGGNSVKFLASVRLRLARRAKERRQFKDKVLKVNVVEVQVAKTKMTDTEGEIGKIWILPGYGVTEVLSNSEYPKVGGKADADEEKDDVEHFGADA